MDHMLGKKEKKFADLVWEWEPISVRELVAVCERELGWKRTTTYTVLKKFENRGLFVNENACISAVVSRQEYYSRQCKRFVGDFFEASLPHFLSAFTDNKLSAEDLAEIRKIIEKYEEEG